MFKLIVTQVSGLLRGLFTRPFSSQEAQHSNSAKLSPVASTPTHQDVQAPAKPKRKRKPSAAPSTKTVKSRKAAPTVAKPKAGVRGRPRKTPAPQSQPHVKRQPKPKP